MTMPAIRTLRIEDAAAIGAMMREFAAYLRSLGDEGELSGSAAIGYLLYHFGFDADRACRIVHVIDLYVRESARHHGTGRALMERARAVCQAAGGGGLTWSVYKPNKLAAGFYERLGAEWIRDLDFMFWEIERG